MGFLSNKIWVRIFLGHPVFLVSYLTSWNSLFKVVEFTCSKRAPKSHCSSMPFKISKKKSAITTWWVWRPYKRLIMSMCKWEETESGAEYHHNRQLQYTVWLIIMNLTFPISKLQIYNQTYGFWTFLANSIHWRAVGHKYKIQPMPSSFYQPYKTRRILRKESSMACTKTSKSKHSKFL